MGQDACAFDTCTSEGLDDLSDLETYDWKDDMDSISAEIKGTYYFYSSSLFSSLILTFSF